MQKMLVFDMDGTIADLYGVEGWLADLRAENPRPYIEAKPMYDMEELKELLLELKQVGFIIAVTTWLAMNSSNTYKTATRQAKAEWLEVHKFPADEIHMVQYGTSKRYVTKDRAGFQVLVDDNDEVREDWKKWHPVAIDAKQDITVELRKLLELAR